MEASQHPPQKLLPQFLQGAGRQLHGAGQATHARSRSGDNCTVQVRRQLHGAGQATHAQCAHPQPRQRVQCNKKNPSYGMRKGNWFMAHHHMVRGGKGSKKNKTKKKKKRKKVSIISENENHLIQPKQSILKSRCEPQPPDFDCHRPAVVSPLKHAEPGAALVALGVFLKGRRAHFCSCYIYLYFSFGGFLATIPTDPIHSSVCDTITPLQPTHVSEIQAVEISSKLSLIGGVFQTHQKIPEPKISALFFFFFFCFFFFFFLLSLLSFSSFPFLLAFPSFPMRASTFVAALAALAAPAAARWHVVEPRAWPLLLCIFLCYGTWKQVSVF
jgi:hypothetical protein